MRTLHNTPSPAYTLSNPHISDTNSTVLTTPYQRYTLATQTILL